MKKLWTIKTGGETWRVKASDQAEAVKIAWEDRPPRSLGCIVQFSNRIDGHSYTLAHVALRHAGYEIEGDDPTLEQYQAAAASK